MKIVRIDGDGIGKEVMPPTVAVLDRVTGGNRITRKSCGVTKQKEISWFWMSLFVLTPSL